MNMQELITAVAYKLPIKFFILNNSFLGMVRQWQELFHAEKYSFTDLSKSNPDFVKMAHAFGAQGLRAETPNDLRRAIRQGFAEKGPTLIEIPVGEMPSPWPITFPPPNKGKGS